MNGPGTDFPGFPSWPVFLGLGILLALTLVALCIKGARGGRQ